VVRLGTTPASTARLTYVSKLMTEANPTPSGLTFQVKAKTKARFAVTAAGPAIALQADAQEFDENDGQIKGFVRSDRRIEIAGVKIPGFHISRANVRVLAVKEENNVVKLRVAATTQPGQIQLRAERPLAKATFGNQNIPARATGHDYELELPSSAQEIELILHF
jgi:hypothetical protein